MASQYSYYSTPNTADANDDFNYLATTPGDDSFVFPRTKRARLDQWTAEDVNSDYLDPASSYHSQAEVPVTATQPPSTPHYPTIDTAHSTFAASTDTTIYDQTALDFEPALGPFDG